MVLQCKQFLIYIYIHEIGQDGKIRPYDRPAPNRPRYQTALYPDDMLQDHYCTPLIRLMYPRAIKLVRVEGFEPPTTCSQSKRSTRLS